MPKLVPLFIVLSVVLTQAQTGVCTESVNKAGQRAGCR